MIGGRGASRARGTTRVTGWEVGEGLEAKNGVQATDGDVRDADVGLVSTALKGV